MLRPFRVEQQRKRERSVTPRQSELDLDYNPDPWGSERFRVRKEMQKDVLLRLKVKVEDLHLDAFADSRMVMWNLTQWWGPDHEDPELRDAFDQDWHGRFMWMNPPYSKMRKVVDKMVADKCRAVMIVPDWRKGTSRYADGWLEELMEYALERYWYAEGVRMFEDTGPTHWPVWGLLVDTRWKSMKFSSMEGKFDKSRAGWRRNWDVKYGQYGKGKGKR